MKPKRKNDMGASGRVAPWQVVWLVALIAAAVSFPYLLSLDYPSDAYLWTYQTPFGGRLFLFSLMLILLSVGYGIIAIWRQLKHRPQKNAVSGRSLWRVMLQAMVVGGVMLWSVALLFGSLSTPNHPRPDIQHLDGIRYNGHTYHAYLVYENVPNWGAVLDAEVFECNWLGRGCERHLTTVTEINDAGYFQGAYPRGIDRMNGQPNSAWLTCSDSQPMCDDVDGSGEFVTDADGALHLCLRPPGMVCVSENIPGKTSPHGAATATPTGP